MEQARYFAMDRQPAQDDVYARAPLRAGRDRLGPHTVWRATGPAGVLGARIARLFEALPEQGLKTDLRRLKQIMETGELVCSDASIHRGKHRARPPNPEALPLVNGMVRS